MARTLGRLIQQLREEAGVSRAALARSAKITPAELSRVEREQRTNLRFRTVCQIVFALEISLDEFAARAGMTKPKALTKTPATGTAAAILSSVRAIESAISKAAAEAERIRHRLDS